MPYFMKKLLLSILLLVIPNILYCQIDITVTEKMPSYIGGEEALMKYINTNAIYTNKAIKDSIEGTVWVSYWINIDGSVSDPKIVRGLHHDLDSISIKLIQDMPKWIPATQNGVPQKVNFTVPVKFKLNGRIVNIKTNPRRYWLRNGKKQFEKSCSEQYGKDKNECDCWYNFIVWNYNDHRLIDLDLKEMFERQKCAIE